MSDIVKEVRIAAPLASVWAALTDAPTIAAWMNDPTVRFDPRVGSVYALFGSETTGTVLRVEAPQRLDYTWRQSSWPPDWQDSLVSWHLSADGTATRLSLTHSRFPNLEERDSHEEGWDIYWIEPMVDSLQRRS